MTDLGLLKQFLGLEIKQYESDIMIRKHTYDSKLLLRLNMDEFNSSNFPFLSTIKLGEIGDFPLVDCSLYRQLVQSLLYLTHTRTDLEYDISAVEIYIHQKNDIHWNEANRILQYVQATRNFGVHFVASSPLELVGFYDLDCVGDPNERNSTSVFVLMFFSGPIYC